MPNPRQQGRFFDEAYLCRLCSPHRAPPGGFPRRCGDLSCPRAAQSLTPSPAGSIPCPLHAPLRCRPVSCARGSFFIAAILAMSYPRLVVFGGAVGALAVMTALSAGFGFLLPSLLPKTYTHYASAVRAPAPGCSCTLVFYCYAGAGGGDCAQGCCRPS